MFWRVVRGMIPYKTARGAAAMDRLKAFEGIPHPFDKQRRVVCPQALKCIKLKPFRKFCVLGELCEKVGWKCHKLINKLETERKERDLKGYWEQKKQLIDTKKKIIEEMQQE